MEQAVQRIEAIAGSSLSFLHYAPAEALAAVAEQYDLTGDRQDFDHSLLALHTVALIGSDAPQTKISVSGHERDLQERELQEFITKVQGPPRPVSDITAEIFPSLTLAQATERLECALQSSLPPKLDISSVFASMSIEPNLPWDSDTNDLIIKTLGRFRLAKNATPGLLNVESIPLLVVPVGDPQPSSSVSIYDLDAIVRWKREDEAVIFEWLNSKVPVHMQQRHQLGSRIVLICNRPHHQSRQLRHNLIEQTLALASLLKLPLLALYAIKGEPSSNPSPTILTLPASKMAMPETGMWTVFCMHYSSGMVINPSESIVVSNESRPAFQFAERIGIPFLESHSLPVITRTTNSTSQ